MVPAKALFVDCQRLPVELLGLAEPIRLHQHLGEVVEGRPDTGMVPAKALLNDRQGLPKERLGVRMEGLCQKQNAKPIHEQCGWRGNVSGGGVLRHGPCMWCKCLGARPIANVARVEWKGRIDPTQRLDETAITRMARHASAGYVLHEAMDQEIGPFGIARD